MTTYSVMEVYPDGSLHNSGRTVSGEKRLLKAEVFKLYGFEGQYSHYYIQDDYGTSVRIKSTFSYASGYLDVWVLTPTNDETEETEHDDGNS